MKELLTTDQVRRLRRTPPTSGGDIYDTKQPRLALRVRPSGQHTYRVLLGRGRWYTLGTVETFTHPDQARTLAQSAPLRRR